MAHGSVDSDQAQLIRRRVDVVAATMARVVRYAGGWMFDRVMAGWDVEVHITDPADARPLRILGVQPVELDHLSARLDGAPPQALAVDGQLYGSDARVRRIVREAVGRLTEVRLWGDEFPADLFPVDLDRASGPVSHQLSIAARAFKAQALEAAAAPDGAMDATETFHCPSRGAFSYGPVEVR